VRRKLSIQKLSVVVATYNRVEYLRLCLASLLAQNYAGRFEIVVADDGSTDDTPAAIDAARTHRAGLELAHCWHEHHAFRKAAIVNEAVRQSSGDLLVFLDSDCIPALGLLKTYAEHATPGAFYLGGVRLTTQEFTQRVLPPNSRPAPEWLIAEVAKARNQQPRTGSKLLLRYWKSLLYVALGVRAPRIWGGNCAVNRQVFEEVNGLDESFVGHGQEDSDLRNRLVRGGYRAVCLHRRAIAYHLWHPLNAEARREALGDGDNRAYCHRPNVEVVCRNGLRKLG